jgi:hypothetical protein
MVVRRNSYSEGSRGKGSRYGIFLCNSEIHFIREFRQLHRILFAKTQERQLLPPLDVFGHIVLISTGTQNSDGRFRCDANVARTPWFCAVRTRIKSMNASRIGSKPNSSLFNIEHVANGYGRWSGLPLRLARPYAVSPWGPKTQL